MLVYSMDSELTPPWCYRGTSSKANTCVKITHFIIPFVLLLRKKTFRFKLREILIKVTSYPESRFPFWDEGERDENITKSSKYFRTVESHRDRNIDKRISLVAGLRFYTFDTIDNDRHIRSVHFSHDHRQLRQNHAINSRFYIPR